MDKKIKILHRVTEFEVSIPEPFDFDLTVAKPAGWSWSSPGEIYEKGYIWAGIYVDQDAAGLKLQQRDDHIHMEVYSNKKLADRQLDYIYRAVEHGLGKDLDMEAFYRFAARDSILKKTLQDLHGMRPSRMDDLFGRVILAISLQMAQLKRSQAIMEDIINHYGTSLNFDGKSVVMWPPPQRMAALEVEELRDNANMGYRAKLLSAAARFLAENPISILELEEMNEEKARERVREVPGVGEYSAGIIIGGSTAPIDAWSVVIMSELLFGKTPEKPRQDIDKINAAVKKRWGKWSWIAFVYIMNDLVNLSQIYPLSRLT
jgi:3-methyladenine DNA glycosylase/8-oxoguanine DNA glycosylase